MGEGREAGVYPMLMAGGNEFFRDILHGHLFCGSGGGAKGFNEGEARVGNLRARFKCLGGIDSDAGAVRDFSRFAKAPGTVLDLFDRDQYRDWHGHEPPPDWREATPADIVAAFQHRRPNILFTSPPCKGFSGLLSQKKSTTARYAALNRLTVRGIMLTLEAYKDDPIEFILMENVPRIMTRGSHLLEQIESLLHSYGYAVARTKHDCGELGGLAQSRPRFLLVARHMEKVPPFLYEPIKKPLRTVGEVLGRLPLPGDTTVAGPMHSIPKLTWKTWLRLALVEAGGDWRSLQRLAVEDGYLRDYVVLPERYGHSGALGVHTWGDSSGVISSRSGPTNGAFSVADVRRPEGSSEYSQYAVMTMDETAGAISGQSAPGGGRYSIADPRPNWHPAASRNKFRVVPWDRKTGTVIGCESPSMGAGSVADPRPVGVRHNNVYRVAEWDGRSPAVTAGGGPSAGGICIADPRPPTLEEGKPYTTNGRYGVVPWEGRSGAVQAAGQYDNGAWSVADPRLPDINEQLVCVIESLDGTWHRPFTTYEKAALQGLVDPDDPYLVLDGRSHTNWNEHIGNMVPPSAAQAIASEMGRTLLLAWTGQTFALGSTPIWVRPVAVALALDHGHVA